MVKVEAVLATHLQVNISPLLALFLAVCLLFFNFVASGMTGLSGTSDKTYITEESSLVLECREKSQRTKENDEHKNRAAALWHANSVASFPAGENLGFKILDI